MKKSLFVIFYFVFQICYGAGTCPSPSCTYTAVINTDYTVNAGETICVNIDLTSTTGIITLNGGTLLIKSGGTVDRTKIAFTTKTITAATIASPIVVTSALHGYTTGQTIGIAGSTTIVGLDGAHTITVIDANTYSLDGSTGSGSFGGTIRSAYVNTISNCGTLTSEQVLNAYTIYNNYADNSIGFRTSTTGSYRGGDYGIINNYGSPTLTFSSWSKPVTVNNYEGGVLSFGSTSAVSISKNSEIYNYSTSANSMQWLQTGIVSFNSGTPVTTLYNEVGATMTFAGSAKVDAANITNKGTMSITTDLTLNNAAVLDNYGTITTVNIDINNGSNTMYGGAVLNVTNIFENNETNSFLFGTGTCSYINFSGATNSITNVLTNAAANKIYYCGSVPGVPGNLGTVTNLGTSGCTPPSCSGALPIDLLSFDTKVKKSSVEIKWMVASQVNNNYFSIERSIDGQNFESIGIVNGAGTTNQLMNYFFEDKNPLSNTSYYRLKQTDFDGKSESFEIKQVNFNSAINSCSIYPNPSEGELVYLKFDNIQNQLINNVKVTVFDMSGELIYDLEIDNDLDKPILLSKTDYKLPKGIYLVKVQHDSDVDFLRLIIH